MTHDPREALERLVEAVANMRVPQSAADAALQVQVTIGPALEYAREALRSEAPASSGVAEDWRDDPSADERWQAGLDFAMIQICSVMGVDPHDVTWDAATEEVEGDVRAVIWNILRAKMGEDWSPSRPDAGGGVLEQIRGWIAFSETETAQKMTVANAELINGESLGDLLRRVDATLSNQPSPVESNGSVEARLREALDSSQWLLALVRDVGPNGDDWRSERLSQLLIQQIVDNREALLSAGGDEAKKSGGGTEGRAVLQHARLADTSLSDSGSLAIEAGIKSGPSDPPDRREIVARLNTLARYAFNEGFQQGMREETSRRGGKTWDEVRSSYEAKILAALDGGR